jgi:hypothetical protein
MFFEDELTPPIYGQLGEMKKSIDDFEGKGIIDLLKKY